MRSCGRTAILLQASLHMVASNARTAAIIIVLFIALACGNRDTSITHGADGQPEWSRRLSAAVPLGISVDSAGRIMESNGFRCREGADSVFYLSCEKLSSKAVVQRRWQAVLNLDARRRVYGVRGFTALIRPKL